VAHLPFPLAGRRRRSARHALLQELSDFCSLADRTELELLGERCGDPGAGEVVAVLRRPAGSRLLRGT
jgi:hypothetical protein